MTSWAASGSRLIPTVKREILGTKNYNRKEVLLKTQNTAVNPLRSAT
jgi:hypothetical protein